MMSEWREVRLKEVISFNPAERLVKGSQAKKIAMDKLFPFSKFIHEYEIAEYNGGAKFRNGDTLLARITPCLENGKTSQVSILKQGEIGFGSTEFIVMREVENVSDKDFIFYLSISPHFRDIAIKSMVGSSGRQRVQQSVLDNTVIKIPRLSEQKRIAAILSVLDDKIELNNRINKNLEAQAQAIFKSWFVNFEPFQDGDFVDSELGKIPKGWRLGTLNDLVESTFGGDWGKEVPSGNYTKEVYCIRGADIPEIKRGNKGKMPARYILHKNFANKQLCNNDIVIEISGGSPTQSTGRSTLITQFLLDRYDKDMICTNFCRAIKPLANYSYYICYLWQYLYNKGVMFSYENGTTGIKNFDINGFLSEETVVIPPCEIAEQFLNVIMPYVKLTYSYGQQNEALSKLRDTLLPKLMSGEIQIPQEV